MEWLTSIKDAMFGWAGGLVGAGLLLFGLKMAAKKVPALLAEWAGKGLKALFEKGDKADDALLLAALKWAEVHMPDRGEGKSAAEKLADAIIKKCPKVTKHRDLLIKLFSESMWGLDDLADELLEKEKPSDPKK